MPIKQQSILVVGGAGYIGSHMVLALQQEGFDVVVLDNLSTGHRSALFSKNSVIGDMGDKKILSDLFTQYSIAAVMHFASSIEVAESMQNPIKYYQNNTASTLTLIEQMLAHGIKHFIFSSTAAVYGEPMSALIAEEHSLQPINPYGKSKWMIEMMLKDIAMSHSLHYAVLRYFNAAGADPLGRTGERHEPESHLIPLVLQVAKGDRPHVTVYGRDYPTGDGTCIRDYIHVNDLCAAHLLALKKMMADKKNRILNLGNGCGHSVQEVIDVARKVTGFPIPCLEGARRAGDPAYLVANPALAKCELGWQPQYGLEDMVKHAWLFMQKHSLLKQSCHASTLLAGIQQY